MYQRTFNTTAFLVNPTSAHTTVDGVTACMVRLTAQGSHTHKLIFQDDVNKSSDYIYR